MLFQKTGGIFHQLNRLFPFLTYRRNDSRFSIWYNKSPQKTVDIFKSYLYKIVKLQDAICDIPNPAGQCDYLVITGLKKNVTSS